VLLSLSTTVESTSYLAFFRLHVCYSNVEHRSEYRLIYLLFSVALVIWLSNNSIVHISKVALLQDSTDMDVVALAFFT